MAKSLEELIILKRTALRYLLARESRLLALGKKPVNKKIANIIRTHQEGNVWTDFLDSFNEDLTRNINVYQWRTAEENKLCNKGRRIPLDTVSKHVLFNYTMPLRGGRMTEAPIVTVEQGQLQGKVVNSPSGKAFYSFQGIPYAKPPLGSLRFRAPQPPEPWEGIRDATAEGNVTAQIDPIFAKSYIGDENCLFLNVYTPTTEGSFLPVMFWIHGGALFYGSGNTDLYGPDYLIDKDVVVVTINYRCGYLGFLSLNTPEVPGNAGLKDMVQALRWVKENIHNFGGNPGNITVFGQSAGGAAVSVLCASPLTKDCFSKAIIQSGNALPRRAFQQDPVQNARDLAQALGCDAEDVDEILEFLMATPARDLVEAHGKLDAYEKFKNEINICGMVIEKEFPGVEAVLTESFIDILTSGRMADVPVMIGTTSLEMAEKPKSDDLQLCIPKELNVQKDSAESLAIAEQIKSLYFKGKQPTDPESLQEYFQLFSDRFFNIDTHRYIKYLVQVTNRPIYFYKFDYVGELNLSNHNDMFTLGYKNAGHSDELGYLFKNDFQKDVEPTPHDIKMRDRMVRVWTNFAKSGNPTPDTNHHLPIAWLPAAKDKEYYLNLGSELTLLSDPDKEKMDFWDDVYNKYFRIWEHPKTNTDEPVRKNAPEVVSVIETVVVTTQVLESSSYEESGSHVVEHHVEETQSFLESEPIQQHIETVEERFDTPSEEVDNAPKPAKEEAVVISQVLDHVNGVDKKPRTSNEIKMAHNSNGVPKDVIRANDPPEDDLPKNIGVNKFVNFFESLGGKK